MRLLMQSMAAACCVCNIAAADAQGVGSNYHRRSRQYWKSSGPDPEVRSSYSSCQPAQPFVLERGMQRCLLFSKQQQADSLEM